MILIRAFSGDEKSAPDLLSPGDGFSPFEPPSGLVNTMTNGTIGKLVNSNGRTLTVKYKDQ